MSSIAISQCIAPKEFEKQYKNHLSDYLIWDQKEHADKWILFENNIGAKLSIDEIAISNGELYTIVTNKAGHGGKGTLVAIIAGTKASEVTTVLLKIPTELRQTVKEVTLDMSHAMDAIITASFPQAIIVTDRFHVAQLVSDAVQEIRISARRSALKEENLAILTAKKEKTDYKPMLYENGDTKKQLLARGHFLLFKTEKNWSEKQMDRAAILFREFPDIAHAYHLSMHFRGWYENKTTKEIARDKLQNWYRKVEEK